MYKKTIGLLLILIMTISVSYAGESKLDLDVGGVANLVMDVEAGRVIHGKNIHSKLPMASTTKIMTALLAIENIPLDKIIRVNEKAEGIEGSSIYLKAHEKISGEDLIYGLMLRSGNDSAAALAYEISGSLEDFAELMNARARAIGAKNTNFVNPHGLHNDNHYTTAYDLALITREALKNPIFRKIVKTKFWLANREGYKHFTNKNNILDTCEGGDGVKTGYTMRSGRCLVASATRGKMQLIAVTLNDYNWFETTKQLLDQAFSLYRPYSLFGQGQWITEIKVLGGKKSGLVLQASRTPTIPLLEGEEESLITVIDLPKLVHAPVVRGQRIGKMTTYLNGEIINTSFLVAGESIEVKSLKDRFRVFSHRF